MTKKIDYSRYIHEYTLQNGEKRYAVCEWDTHGNNWVQPMDNAERKLTGCFAYFSNDITGFGYKTRAKARYEARKRFGLGEFAPEY